MLLAFTILTVIIATLFIRAINKMFTDFENEMEIIQSRRHNLSEDMLNTYPLLRR